ncbi:nuclear transport factor 2 domain-containing protein [Truncatella angustata]|uniref:Nuclear transport factor 2 domain-containing protein n=1 Tax=Truncatella angustata TaxID=152316 RepID=A0A9P9A2V1_9PEZI|nr:nuclear transport factor 2 domain-containing protein [Truncatella angustata]KAH6658310.1 nuclear transport factor 2 domain-containing protein [Truncatella angustata]KAH8200789.1 hypothetical protein TruAng_005026 [Truncatella angustata]
MPLPSIETQVKVASEAADRFVEHYYDALNKHHRGTQLSQFYVSTSAKLTGAGLKPDISINGHVCAAGVPELEELIEKQGRPVHFEVQSVDAHPINPHYVLGSTNPEAQNDKGDKLSFTIQVGGTVKFGKGEDGTIRAFNDAFMLVPHWEAQGRNAARTLQRWLIVSQNSRYL